jgi:hypothetical protein
MGMEINRSLLGEKFRPFYQSEKIYDPQIHGKNGVGRLTFFPVPQMQFGQPYIKKKIKPMIFDKDR